MSADRNTAAKHHAGVLVSVEGRLGASISRKLSPVGVPKNEGGRNPEKDFCLLGAVTTSWAKAN